MAEEKTRTHTRITPETERKMAAGMKIPEEQLRELRGRCVQNVKKTSGGITLEKAVAYQNGED